MSSARSRASLDTAPRFVLATIHPSQPFAASCVPNSNVCPAAALRRRLPCPEQRGVVRKRTGPDIARSSRTAFRTRAMSAPVRRLGHPPAIR
ncbi:hypothetical protein PsYK624_151840 [Phanerochaete sordida]|uniref:Uncharacterized protein n=1 Tax=Phanerochaete sordida TaxID=48140 RepID=A0A9P3GPT0_9APHY|nr:hypothetical protein PsYK624_151840 [Phanerochaete sordida]